VASASNDCGKCVLEASVCCRCVSASVGCGCVRKCHVCACVRELARAYRRARMHMRRMYLSHPHACVLFLPPHPPPLPACSPARAAGSHCSVPLRSLGRGRPRSRRERAKEAEPPCCSPGGSPRRSEANDDEANGGRDRGACDHNHLPTPALPFRNLRRYPLYCRHPDRMQQPGALRLQQPGALIDRMQQPGALIQQSLRIPVTSTRSTSNAHGRFVRTPPPPMR